MKQSNENFWGGSPMSARKRIALVVVATVRLLGKVFGLFAKYILGWPYTLLMWLFPAGEDTVVDRYGYYVKVNNWHDNAETAGMILSMVWCVVMLVLAILWPLIFHS